MAVGFWFHALGYPGVFALSVSDSHSTDTGVYTCGGCTHVVDAGSHILSCSSWSVLCGGGIARGIGVNSLVSLRTWIIFSGVLEVPIQVHLYL